MNQFGSSYFMYLENKRRHEELIEKAAQYRLVDDAVRAESPKMRRTSKILASVGKGLASLGASLEERYSGSPESNLALNQQSNMTGCS